jgi:hypothetical protein
MIRHRREPSRSLSRGAEPRRRRGSIPAPQIREQRHRNKPPAFQKRFCLLLPRMAKVGRPQARSAGRNGFAPFGAGFRFHVSGFRTRR